MQPNFNKNDITQLMAIFKKLGLSVPKVLKAQTYLSSNKLTAEEKARKLFNVPENEDLNDFLKERLTEREIETLREAIGMSR